MTERKYRVAVVGGAGMWGRHYLRVFAEHPECQLVGLVDRARQRREQFAQRYGVRDQFDTVAQLLAQTVPDIVAAVVPVGQNLPVVRACAEAGVRVVSCEKPIGAVLSEADAMLEVCRRHGTLLGCGQAAWATPYMPQVIRWIHAGGIGRITGVAIPGGLPVEVSGAGCVQLSALRIVTRLDAAWVEGWELPPVPGYVAPGTVQVEADVPAYGRVGLTDGTVCQIPAPGAEPHASAFMSITGEDGQVWLGHPRPVLIQGRGPAAVPVYPDFLDAPADDFFRGSVLRLLEAFDTGQEPLSSGADYHHALEVAIALKLSAADGHRRVALPLPERAHRLLPHPYRLFGGDVAGWQSIGYSGPPQVPLELRAVAEFGELSAVSHQDVRRLVQAVDPADLALALQGTEPVMRRRAVHALPDALQHRVKQALEAAGEVSSEQIEAAQRRIVAVARAL